MDNKAFREQMARIIDTFGQENYSKERLKLIHKELQPLTNSELKWAIDHLIATVPTKYPPLVPRFVEAMHGALKRRFESDVKVAKQKIDRRSGLEEELKKRGVRSLVEAISKSKVK